LNVQGRRIPAQDVVRQRCTATDGNGQLRGFFSGWSICSQCATRLSIRPDAGSKMCDGRRKGLLRSAHADNVAPALIGGITVITGYEPLNVFKLLPVEGTAVVEVNPRIELAEEKTKLAREVLPSSVPLSKVVGQMEAFASLLLGIVKKDAALMGRGISSDVIIEPARAKLIKGFNDVKRAAIQEGAHGATISGAGPTVFALAPIERADVVGKAMVEAFSANSIKSAYAIYQCSQEGTKIV